MKKLLFFLLIIFSQWANAQRAVPELWGHRVHDEANVLSVEAVEELERMLQMHEDSTSNQIAILIIPSLEGDNLEEYSLKVAHDKWKLGVAEKDNGILLLIVVNEHKVRIEVGHGLEGVVPDAIASRIIRNEMAPYFRENNYNDGVKAGVQAIIRAIGNEYEEAEETAELTLEEKIIGGGVIFFILFIFTFIGALSPGCMGWGLYAFLIPFYAAFSFVIFGNTGGFAALGTYLAGFPILRSLIGKTAWGKKLHDKWKTPGGGGSGGGGWFSGWSSGGGGWSTGGGSWSSGSSGGFSGGGGSFGGGGSSGSW
jgi:uncharacterized protein